MGPIVAHKQITVLGVLSLFHVNFIVRVICDPNDQTKKAILCDANEADLLASTNHDVLLPFVVAGARKS